ncbi:MAG: methylated-DNA--[protein]-cysteine S-methyltransferase [Proteobacteria bacterium]|nr:methylated-DNA--[protein]-cysteine S-methyltransferase [Pseudomonadota bacterium]
MTDPCITLSLDYRRIESAIRYLERNATAQPDLETLARHVGLSEFHFQRLFRRWAGISPKRFLQFLTLSHAKRLLAESHPVLDTAFEAGLSGPGRLHDLFVTYEAMTPGRYKRRGEGLEIVYGFHPSPFGESLLLATEHGVCGLGFTRSEGRAATLAEFKSRWPCARYRPEPAKTAPLAADAFPRRDGSGRLALSLSGTRFQLKVWEALIRIPAGAVTSYGELARRIGRPGGARAVAGAVAANPISFVIPCHRVIRESGSITGYEWGVPRKRAILAWEAARRSRCLEGGPAMKPVSRKRSDDGRAFSGRL